MKQAQMEKPFENQNQWQVMGHLNSNGKRAKKKELATGMKVSPYKNTTLTVYERTSKDATFRTTYKKPMEFEFRAS